MEEDARFFTKPHLVQQHYNAQYQANSTNKGKSCSHIFLKFLFIALFLCLIPLFPSEPPEFISDTIFAKTWELIHLLIIGIALSYGLFCRPKATQIPHKTQISQPYAPNILHHYKIFDYEEGNPSGVSDKYVIPTQSFNLSHYKEEPVTVLSRKDSKSFEDRPLGLPVRSLKSRVVDSDSEEQEEEEESCASECDSDMSGGNSNSSSEKDEILEENAGKSSMRGDVAENDNFEGKQSKFKSFKSPVTAASFCQNFCGLCSWLPESPKVEHRDNGGKDKNFYMPFSNLNQANDFNVMGMSPNLQNNSNFSMPPAAAVHSSMPFSAGGFASNWGNANIGNGNMCVENSGFSMPPTAVPSSMPIPASDLASRSRKYKHDIGIGGKSPNLQNETLGGGNPNHYTHSAAFSPTVHPASADGFVSSVEASKNAKINDGFSHKNKDEIRSESKNVALGGNNEHWGNANFNGYTSVEYSRFSMPPTAVPSSMSTPASEYASRSRRYNHETENRGKSPNPQKEIMGGVNPNLSMPSATFLPRVPASSIEASKNAKFNNGSSLKTKAEKRSENNNVPSSKGNINTFMPSAAFPPSMPTSADEYASSIKASKNAKMSTSAEGYASSVKESKNAKMPSSTEDYASSVKAAKNAKMPTSTEEYTSLIKTSQNAKFNHGCSLSSNVALGGENTNIFMPAATCSPSKPDPATDSASSVEAFTNAKFSHGSSLKKKDELRSEHNNVAFSEDNKNFPIPSAAFSPTMTASTDFPSSIKPAKNANGSALKKKDEMRSKGNKVALESSKETTNTCSPHSDLPSGSKSLELENENLGAEKPSYFMNTTKVLPSVPPTFNEFASLVNDENKSEEHVASSQEKSNSDAPHIADPFSFQTDIPPKKNEQRAILEKWGDDCFVIPSSEKIDAGDIVLENLPPLTISEASPSAGSSSRKSSHEQESPQNKVDEVLWSAPRNNSEIEDVAEDVLGENDSYKPSTPSPPPRLQTQRNELLASSVESSSRALGNQSFLNDDDDGGSPPTPERRTTLSRVSNSRRFSCGYFFDRDLRKSFKDEAKETNKNSKGDDDQFARGGKCGWDCLKLDVKPAFNRAALKGKSVRTIKPKETAQDQQKNGQIELKHKEYIEGLSEATGGERKGEKPETLLIKIGISEKRSNSNGQKGEKQQGDGGTTSIIVGLNSKEKSYGTTVVPVANDVKEEGNDSEIDKKADEFIARFKQQMRRQKVGPRGDPSRQHKKSLYRS